MSSCINNIKLVSALSLNCERALDEATTISIRVKLLSFIA